MSIFSKMIMSFITVLFLGPLANASIGFNLGAGLPYFSQYGLNYVHSSNSFSIDLSYHVLSIEAGLAKAELNKPEFNMKWHPFSGSFFFGLGIGQSTLSVTATDVATSETAKIEVTSLAITPSLGWMWGMANAGFFMGMDFGYQTPSGAKTTVTSSLPTTNQAHIDAVEQGEKFGETAFPVITFFRIGYLF